MRYVIAAIAASAALLGATAPASAQRGVTVLQPSSQWNVDFAPTKCRLARMFGEGEDQHLLFFEQHYPAESTALTVAGPAFQRFRSRVRTSLSFFEGDDVRRSEPFAGEVDGVGKAIIYSSFDLDTSDDDSEGPQTLQQLDTEFAGQMRYVSVRQGSRMVRFDTGPLDEAFAVLNTCTQDMIRDWGLDVEQHLTASRMPQWINERTVGNRIAREYPSEALSEGDQAIMRMRVIVDETGKIERCTIDAATDNALESPACGEMERAEFEPALDANGEPFRSYYATSIIYRIGR